MDLFSELLILFDALIFFGQLIQIWIHFVLEKGTVKNGVYCGFSGV